MLLEAIAGATPYWLGLSAFNRHTQLKSKKWFHKFFQGDQVEQAYIWAQKAAARKLDVYVRCTLLKYKPSKGRGGGNLTAGSNVLWADVDSPNDPLETNNPSCQAFLKAFPPSLIVSSGNGYHLYWQLDEFCEDPNVVARANKYIADRLEPIGADQCWDHAHILRIPNTFNNKSEPPKPVELLHPNEDEEDDQYQVYSIDDFELAPISEPSTHKPDSGPGEIPDDLLEGLGSKLKKAIVEGLPGKDRSSTDYHIACQLLNLGHSESTIRAVLSSCEWASGSKANSLPSEQGKKYVDRTIASAKEAHGKSQSQVLLGSILDKVLYRVDANGAKKRIKLNRGSDLTRPVLHELERQGCKLFRDPIEGRGYLVTPQGQVLHADANDPEFQRWLYDITGYTSQETEHKILRAGLADDAQIHGRPARIKPWVSLSSDGFSAVLDLDGRQVVRTSAKEPPETILNGNRGLLVQTSTQVQHEIELDLSTSQSYLAILERLFTQTLACDKTAREILTCYLLAAPLHRGVEITTYPLLHLTGPSGGGKTQTLKLISTFFHGFPRLSNPTAAAFYRVASRELLLPFDDYDNLPPYLKEIILTSTTGIVRQKSSRGAETTHAQRAHVLMALTSTTPLPDEMTRRRALVIEINKSVWPSDIPYNEEHWKEISNRRSKLWSAYVNAAHQTFLPYLATCNFKDLILTTERHIEVDIFKGLAGFLALMRSIGRCLEQITKEQKTYRPFVLSDWGDWAEALSLTEQGQSEIDDRSPALSAILAAFEAYWGESESGKPSFMRDDDFRLTANSPTDGTRSQQRIVSLEGTSTEWMITLRTVTKGQYRVETPAKLGYELIRLLGRKPQFDKGRRVSQPLRRGGLTFYKLKQTGPYRSANGWRVEIEQSDLNLELIK